MFTISNIIGVNFSLFPFFTLVLFFFSLFSAKYFFTVICFKQTRRLMLLFFISCCFLDSNLLVYLYNIQGDVHVFFGAFKVNFFLFFFKLLIEITALVILILTYAYDLYFKLYAPETVLLFLTVIFGAFSLVFANSFLSAYLALELQTIPLYVLASLFRLSKKSVESGLKYFILNVFSSSVFLYSSALIYYVSGVFNFGELVIFLNLASGTVFKNSVNYFQIYCFYTGLVGLCVSLFFKLSAAPFHFWTPEIYEGAPASIVFIFSTIPKLSVSVFLISLFTLTFFAFSSFWAIVFLFFGVISIIIGMFGAFYYSKITKILAFGATAHVGYILLALGSLSTSSTKIAVFYLVVYVVTSMLFFAVWLNVMFGKNMICNYVDDLAGFSKVSMVNTVLLSIAVFSFAGIPPFAGFIAKLFVIQGLSSVYFVNLALLVLVLSAISAVYYLRFIKIMFFSPSSSIPAIFFLPPQYVLFVEFCLAGLVILLALVFFFL
jgi:NADH-quinone oxidoreductase subunit N